MRRSHAIEIALGFAGTVLFRLALDASYVLVVTKSYESVGFQYYPDAGNYMVSWMAALCGVLLYVPVRRGLAVKLAQFLFLVTYIPSTSYFALSGQGGNVLVYGLVFWAIVTALVWAFSVPSAPTVPKGAGAVLLICFSIGISAVILSFVVFGWQLNFSLVDVYDFRYARRLNAIPLGGYLIPWAAKVAVPFLILYCWYELRPAGKLVFLFAILIQVLLFATSGHKTFLFIAPAALFLGWAVAKDRFSVLLPYFLAFGIGLATTADVISGDYLWSGLLTRRVFFVPAELTHYYFEYFNDNHLHLSHSLLSFILTYPYAIPPSNVIGSVYFGSPTMSANTGVLADGFMNFGLSGVVGWGLLVGALFLLSEAVTLKRNPHISYPLIILSVYNLANGALFTSLLTHGLMLAIFLSALMAPKTATQTGAGQRATQGQAP